MAIGSGNGNVSKYMRQKRSGPALPSILPRSSRYTHARTHGPSEFPRETGEFASIFSSILPCLVSFPRPFFLILSANATIASVRTFPCLYRRDERSLPRNYTPKEIEIAPRSLYPAVIRSVRPREASARLFSSGGIYGKVQNSCSLRGFMAADLLRGKSVGDISDIGKGTVINKKRKRKREREREKKKRVEHAVRCDRARLGSMMRRALTLNQVMILLCNVS